MKTVKKICIIAATASALALSSCQREPAPTLTGEEIIFTAGSESVDTKSVYSGYVYDNRERIDWQNGDLVRIFCDQLSNSPKYGDYYMKELLGPDEEKPYISKARLREVNNKPLIWGESSDHYFYGVSPSPEYGGSSVVSIGKNSTSGHVEVAASIPTSQPYCGEVAQDGVRYIVQPDLSNMVMTAKAGPYSVEADMPGRDEVFMSFIPLTTAIRFTITNQTKEPLDIVSVSLISDNHALSGDFTVDIDNASTPADVIVGGKTIASYDRAYPACNRTGAVDDLKTVTIPFEGVVLPYDEDKSKCGSLTFTFFVQPTEHLDDLTFKIVKKTDDGTCWLSTKLAYADAARTGLTFPKHKKSDVTGLLIPEGAIWTVKYDPEIVSWDAKDHGEITPGPEFNPDVLVTQWTIGIEKNIEMLKYNYSLGLAGEMNFGQEGTATDGPVELSVESIRENENAEYSVLWYMEYCTDEENDTWAMVKSGQMMNGLATITAADPSRLVSQNDEVMCIGNANLTMSVAAASGTEIVESQSHTSRLASAAAVRGTQIAPYDLSMHTIYGDEREKAKTANCYIVKGQGWYAFPLVYGNAIDDNVAPAGFINVNAYNPGGETDPTTTILTRFRNYKGYGIREPYIEGDLAVIPDTPSRHVTGADVVWQSGSCIKSCSILSATAAWDQGLTSMKGTGMDTNACGYVVFQVDGTIEQGNAVIAVKDEDGKIIWSWHIWITDDEMDLVSYRNFSGQTVKMLPVNLGWVDSDNRPFTYYEGKSLKLRLVQEGSNIVKEFTIVRRPETTALHEAGTCTYYQWGRKDPMLSGCATAANSSATDIAYSIQNPDKFVTGGNNYYYESINEVQTNYYNLWSALNKGVGAAASNYSSTTIKTIYDPCPPGFQIPHGTAYTGFTKTGDNSTSGSDFNVSGSFNTGWYFTSGAGDESNFFPAEGYIVYGSGSVDKSDTNGYYWTSVPQDSQKKALGFEFSGSAVSVTASANQSDGFTVRPVMEEHL